MFVLQVNAEKTADLHDLAIDHVLSMVNAAAAQPCRSQQGGVAGAYHGFADQGISPQGVGVQRQGIVVLEAQGGGVDDYVEILRIAVTGTQVDLGELRLQASARAGERL